MSRKQREENEQRKHHRNELELLFFFCIWLTVIVYVTCPEQYFFFNIIVVCTVSISCFVISISIFFISFYLRNNNIFYFSWFNIQSHLNVWLKFMIQRYDRSPKLNGVHYIVRGHWTVHRIRFFFFVFENIHFIESLKHWNETKNKMSKKLNSSLRKTIWLLTLAKMRIQFL